MSLAVNISTASGTIQVALGEGYQLEVVDTWNNRRLLLVLLRLVQGPRGKPALTFADIAQAFGYADRRNVNNFWREFEQSGEDFFDYLQRKYKIDATIRDMIWQVFLEDIWASTERVTAAVRQRLPLGAKDVSESTVRRVLADGLKVQTPMKRMLATGQAHLREAFLIEELFRTIQQLLEGNR